MIRCHCGGKMMCGEAHTGRSGSVIRRKRKCRKCQAYYYTMEIQEERLPQALRDDLKHDTRRMR